MIEFVDYSDVRAPLCKILSRSLVYLIKYNNMLVLYYIVWLCILSWLILSIHANNKVPLEMTFRSTSFFCIDLKSHLAPKSPFMRPARSRVIIKIIIIVQNSGWFWEVVSSPLILIHLDFLENIFTLFTFHILTTSAVWV